ncbi:MAG: glycoside hydrolase family protein [Opitutales bacterium]
MLLSRSIVLVVLLTASTLVTGANTAAPAISGKKGVGVWPYPGLTAALREIDVSWYYNWRPAPPDDAPEGIEFVPMIWDETYVTDKHLAAARVSGSTLLGFNEPDHHKQADMTVAQALELWPRLEATGMRLGSPASASGAANPDSWFGCFMSEAEARGYRIDFICVHRYERTFDDPEGGALDLENFLTRVYERYQKPLWLTEFALSNWKEPAAAEQQEAYLKAVVPMLERLPFVERYAWFALPPNETGDGGALVSASLSAQDGTLNALGAAYQQSGRTASAPASAR